MKAYKYHRLSVSNDNFGTRGEGALSFENFDYVFCLIGEIKYQWQRTHERDSLNVSERRIFV